jgi:hypothetical protein
MTWKDELLLREYEMFETVAPIDKGIGPRAPLPADDSVPAAMFQQLADRYGRLNTECAEAHREAKRAREAYSVMAREADHRSELWKSAARDAARYRLRYGLAAWALAVVMAVAIVGWMR